MGWQSHLIQVWEEQEFADLCGLSQKGRPTIIAERTPRRCHCAKQKLFKTQCLQAGDGLGLAVTFPKTQQPLHCQNRPKSAFMKPSLHSATNAALKQGIFMP